MVAMGSCRNYENKQLNKEISCLSKDFTALNINNKRGVLKTAQGLLKIQRTYKEMAGDGTEYSVSAKYKNG